MIINEKQTAAEIILNELLNKNNKELFDFIMLNCSGTDFQHLYLYQKSISTSDHKDKFFEDLRTELNPRTGVLSNEELKIFLKQQIEKNNITEKFEKTIYEIKDKDFSKLDIETTIKPTLVEAIKYSKTYTSIINSIDEGSMDGFCKNVYSQLTKINNIDFRKRDSEITMDNFSEIMKMISDVNTQYISTGFRALDRLLNGGIPKDDTYLALIMASSGVGKSMYMLNIAYNMLKTNPNTNILLFTLEMSKDVYTKRFVSLATRYFSK